MARLRVKGLRSLRRSLRSYARDVRVEVALEMTAVMEEIQDAAREMAPFETGQLEGSIQPSPRVVDADELTGRVTANTEYAAVQEFGFTGTVSVDAHKRTMKQGFGDSSNYPMTVTIPAHTRRMDIEGNFYLTKAAQTAKQTYSKRIGDAIQRAQ
ncbi:HK97 gp10 family phage protein [Salinibacter altiplanensis]|uniref:HK97 gp10 family phage protein n=1 Tax=Salinibacter altiplanensis TaxID=1803181 RepID=UPI000C9FD8F9|nr:HK97 gp10 family phage protein [Salinibacter altiplanensis]